MKVWEKIKGFFKKLFRREDRIEMAVRVARALKNFSDSAVDDIIVYTLTVVAPKSAAITALIKNFLTDDLPLLLQALELMDAGDVSDVNEENITSIAEAVKKMASTVDEEDLLKAISLVMEDGRLTLSEAKELLSKYNNTIDHE